MDPQRALLVLDQDALLAVLEEHGQLSRTLLRLLATKLHALRRVQTGRRPAAPAVGPRLDLVSRMLLLREALGLGGDGMAVVARLARVVHARRVAPGAALWSPEQVAEVVIVVEGTVRLHGTGSGDRVVGPGEALGLVESVAGIPMEEQALTLQETTVVVLSHPELTEAIEDDDPLCFELIRSFAAQISAVVIDAGGALDPQEPGNSRGVAVPVP